MRHTRACDCDAMAGRSKAAERQQQRLREAEDRANEAFDLVAPLTEEIDQLTEKLHALSAERDHLLELNQKITLDLHGSTEQCDKWAGMYAEVLRKSTRRLTELACEVSPGLLGSRANSRTTQHNKEAPKTTLLKAHREA